MTEWFECKVKYDKTMEDGLIKSTSETYLVDAISFTEAEKRFIEEIEPFMAGEFVVSDIRRARFAEVMESEDLTDDKWFKARVAYITIDEKKGTEKRAVQSILVQAKDFRVALKNLDKGMAGTLGDWEIVSITETKIVDIFKATPDEEPQGDNQPD
ncbi:MAG: DUF4494 domain-containing protein [Bacteroidaceae bacterium]|nr:DUF4494 domain-containing protein [Bacteroidaceae bacterium]